MGVKHEAPKGHLRDLRFLLLGSVATNTMLPVGLGNQQPLNEYRAEMALHRRSLTASKRRRASTKKASPKPSAAPRKRSANSKAKTAAS